jgi:uncharacterized protein
MSTPSGNLETPNRVNTEMTDPFAHPGRDRKRHSLVARGLMSTVTGYQRYISPLKGVQTCRFYPTCSQYALEAIGKHGATKGTFLAVRRVLKCQPFHPGGFDPVP